MEQRQYEEMVLRLVTLLEGQEILTQKVQESLAKQDTINERLTGAIERLDVTLQAIRDLLERGNGH